MIGFVFCFFFNGFYHGIHHEKPPCGRNIFWIFSNHRTSKSKYFPTYVGVFPTNMYNDLSTNGYVDLCGDKTSPIIGRSHHFAHKGGLYSRKCALKFHQNIFHEVV